MICMSDTSVKEILDFFASAGVTELTESLGSDLADTLTGNIEFLTDFFKSA